MNGRLTKGMSQPVKYTNSSAACSNPVSIPALGPSPIQVSEMTSYGQFFLYNFGLFDTMITRSNSTERQSAIKTDIKLPLILKACLSKDNRLLFPPARTTAVFNLFLLFIKCSINFSILFIIWNIH